mmetsp:Transcript_70151/g.124851  ORF Transcript_70151/g.124851 Transcript_70151/m.124851 type:complete len:627 (+) Transcript_70151:111-1991(+)
MTVETVVDIEASIEDQKKDAQTRSEQYGTLVTFQQVGFSLPAKKRGGEPIQILKDVSGFFQPGTLTATMGPSGAGKTTFLDIVTGRKKQGSVTGDLLYNGVKATPAFLRNYTAYVEQFDTLLATLTVRQMLLYQTELKCSRREPLAAKKERVERLLVDLGLEGCADVMIGDALHPGISGGQAKRTNIGIALVTQPKLIFLDEPTSGLDSETSLDVVSILRKLADQGVTIMSTIHSPPSEAFRLFDNLLLLVKGETVYFGALHGDKGATGYFAGDLGIHFDPKANLADCLIRETGDSGRKSVADVDFGSNWRSSERSKAAKAECEALLAKHASEMPQVSDKGFLRHNSITAVGVLLRYRTRANYKFPDFVAPRISPMVLFGFIIASLYWKVGADAKDPANVSARGNAASALFMSTALPSFTAAGYMPSIVQERPLFYRETADGCYSALTYILYKLVEEAIPQVFGSFIFCCLTIFLIDLQGNFFWQWLIFYVVGQTGIALAYCCGAIARNMDEANTLLPVYNVTGMFFTGALFTYDQIPSGWKWYTWTCFVRYAWCAMMVNNFGEKCELDASNPLMQTPGCPIEYFGIENGSAGTSVAANFAVLVGFWLFFVCLAWLVMANVRHSSR